MEDEDDSTIEAAVEAVVADDKAIRPEDVDAEAVAVEEIVAAVTEDAVDATVPLGSYWTVEASANAIGIAWIITNDVRSMRYVSEIVRVGM